eukprot:RCo033814
MQNSRLPPLSPSHSKAVTSPIPSLSRITVEAPPRLVSHPLERTPSEIQAGGLVVCVGVDHSDISRIAFEAMLRLQPTRIFAVHCTVPMPTEEEQAPEPPHKASGSALRRTGSVSKGAVNTYEHIAFNKGVFNVQYAAVEVKSTADIPEALVTFACRRSCNLIAVGTRCSDIRSARRVTHISDMVVRSSHVPVCVVRVNLVRCPAVNYVVAIDDSAVTVPCLQFVKSLATASDKVSVICCNSTMKAATECLQRSTAAAGLVSSPGSCTVETMAIARKPEISLADNICKVAEDMSADVLILASGWKRRSYDLGSTTSSCIYNHSFKGNLLVYKNASLLQLPESGRTPAFSPASP